ncbi:hypothetical protein P280DRAFT_231405 [Massarina eburnea CBS 473.64]|uniref:Uncharacterized protein n=1 Tax=Massarina eburnea CBS 473.64 TaxID=1395130 RepID=A0A6A6SAV7_9PLEO|nr:hypothetical protein P280DRAFT_231405 [Massarina eburnea CBS 473.64]
MSTSTRPFPRHFPPFNNHCIHHLLLTNPQSARPRLCPVSHPLSIDEVGTDHVWRGHTGSPRMQLLLHHAPPQETCDVDQPGRREVGINREQHRKRFRNNTGPVRSSVRLKRDPGPGTALGFHGALTLISLWSLFLVAHPCICRFMPTICTHRRAD